MPLRQLGNLISDRGTCWKKQERDITNADSSFEVRRLEVAIVWNLPGGEEPITWSSITCRSAIPRHETSKKERNYGGKEEGSRGGTMSCSLRKSNMDKRVIESGTEAISDKAMNNSK